jgi:hypothetical protein
LRSRTKGSHAGWASSSAATSGFLLKAAKCSGLCLGSAYMVKGKGKG